MLRFALTCLAALALAGCAAKAGEQEQPPTPALELTGRVVDAAEILSPEFERGLASNLAQLEEQTLVQFVVATTSSLNGYDIDTYALDLGNAWGLGDHKRNDGLLLLVAPNERRVRISVGLGLETAITNEEAQIIIDTDILPQFRQSNYEDGIAAGVAGLARELAQPALKEAA